MKNKEKKSQRFTMNPKNHAPYQIQEEGEAIVEYLQPTEVEESFLQADEVGLTPRTSSFSKRKSKTRIFR